MKNWSVCYHHGAGGGAPKGKRNGRYVHGHYCKTAIAKRQIVRDLLRDCTDILKRATSTPQPSDQEIDDK
jgi:hypothetical protein